MLQHRDVRTHARCASARRCEAHQRSSGCCRARRGQRSPARFISAASRSPESRRCAAASSTSSRRPTPEGQSPQTKTGLLSPLSTSDAKHEVRDQNESVGQRLILETSTASGETPLTASCTSCSRWWCRNWGRRGTSRRAASGRRTACSTAHPSAREAVGAGWGLAARATSMLGGGVDAVEQRHRRLDRRRVGDDVEARAGLDRGLLDARQRRLRALVDREDAELGPLLEAEVVDRQAPEDVVDEARGERAGRGRRSCPPARSACS